MHEYKDAVAGSLGGSEAPKKEIKHIITRKAHSGGHIHTHVHTNAHHPDEDHVTHNDDQMAEHMLAHMGTPNTGEQEADAGQSGMPPAAGGAMPPAGMPAA